MHTTELSNTLTTLFNELVSGPPADAYMLNAGDEGLLRSLDKLSANAASALTPTGSSIAAHVDHVRYGLSLMNRWAAGEKNPFGDADWSVSWKKTTVSDEDWKTRRAELRTEATRWLDALRTPREVQEIELNGVIGSIAHLAYHLGAIRQINQITRGPAADIR